MNPVIDITGAVIKTERLTLRPWRETDLDDFYEYARVDGVGQMAGWTPHKSKAKSRDILSQFIAGKHVFALEYRGKVIGSLGIEEYNEVRYPTLGKGMGRELGYVLSRDYWGMGLMPEAVNAAIGYCFQTLKLDFLMVGHFEHNLSSRRVAEKTGFRYCGNSIFCTQYGTEEHCRDYILYAKEWQNDTQGNVHP